ncbi:MAG: hypothetical protein ABIH23_17115 [bacterium]
MEPSLEDILLELTGDISGSLSAIRGFAEPKSVRIIAPCLSSLQDGMKRLESLEGRLSTLTENQLRAELITVVRNLIRTFDQLKRSNQVELSWYEGESGSGIPPALSKAREILGL